MAVIMALIELSSKLLARLRRPVGSRWNTYVNNENSNGLVDILSETYRWRVSYCNICSIEWKQEKWGCGNSKWTNSSFATTKPEAISFRSLAPWK